MPITNDAIARFLSRYEKPAAPDISTRHPPLAEMVGHRDALSAIIDPLPLPDLTTEERDDMAGKRSPELQDLIFECAAGLRSCPEIAEEVGIKPAEVEIAAHQDMSVGGLIRAMQSILEGADTALLIAAGEADTLCEKAQEIFLALLGDPALPRPQHNALRYACAEPLRLRAEAQARVRGPQIAVVEEDPKGQAQKKQQVYQMLMDLKDGKDATVSRGLAQVSAKKGG